MTANTGDGRFALIAEKICELTGMASEKITRKTSVHRDADLVDDRYDMFLRWISDRFNIDLTGMERLRVAGIHAFLPSDALGLDMWPKRYLDLTVGDFVLLSEAGSWKASGLARSARRNYLGRLGQLAERLTPLLATQRRAS